MVLSLDKCNIGTDVELVLELAHQLEQHLLLFDKSELGVVEQISVLLLRKGRGLLLLFL